MEVLKQKIVKAGQKWVAQQVDVAVEHNPRLSFISKRLKDGLSQMIVNKVDKIDGLLPFITDANGQLNVTSLSEELLNAFEEMPISEYYLMGLDIEVGKGSIVVSFPDNIFTSLFLDNNKLLIGRDELMRFVELLKK